MMAMHRVLKGKRIAVLAADAFEQVELTISVTVLRLAGATIKSLAGGRNDELPGRSLDERYSQRAL